MSLDTLLTQTARVTTRQEWLEDEYGSPILEDGSTITYDARLEQGSTSEFTVGMDRVLTDLVCYLPGDAVIGHLDKVVIDGVTYEVMGEPEIQRSPRGPHHIAAGLRRIQGG